MNKEPFWRNDIVHAWCLSGGSGKGYFDGWIDSYWIGFYDKDAKHHAGKIIFNCNCMEDMYSYDFTKFFDYEEIDNKVDLELQEKLLEIINWLIYKEIIKIRK